MTFEGTLLFALDAVSLALIFLSHIDLLFATHSKLREPPASERAYNAHDTREVWKAGGFEGISGDKDENYLQYRARSPVNNPEIGNLR